MNILLGCNHLHELGGSEQFNYTLAKALKDEGANVYVMLGNHTLKGLMSDKMKVDLDIDVDVIPKNIKIDAVLLSHNSTISRFNKEVFSREDLDFNENNIYQICHGKFHDVERPQFWNKLKYLCISEEISEYVINIIRDNSKVFIIQNPIDIVEFNFTEINEKPKKLYSLSQSQIMNQMLSEICTELGIAFDYNNKHTNPTNNIASRMLDADIVVSLGRGCYEAMSMGKNVIVADYRDYMNKGLMDGMINNDNFDNFLQNNCSGRFSNIEITKEKLIAEINKYSKIQGSKNREFAEKYFNSNEFAKLLISIF